MVQQKFAKPKAVLFDISGTAVKDTFIEKILLPYFSKNVKEYVEEMWTNKDLMKDVERLRKQASGDSANGAPIVAGADADVGEQQRSIIDYVNWCMTSKRETNAIQKFRFRVWFDGYSKGKICTPVYSDVVIQLKKWKCSMDIKLFVYSNGWSEATKKFLSNTNHGDLSFLISGYYDTSLGKLTESSSYQNILGQIGEPAGSVYFLTKSGAEARAAHDAGIKPILVLTHRKNIDKLEESEKQFSKVRTFNEIEFE